MHSLFHLFVIQQSSLVLVLPVLLPQYSMIWWHYLYHISSVFIKNWKFISSQKPVHIRFYHFFQLYLSCGTPLPCISDLWTFYNWFLIVIPSSLSLMEINHYKSHIRFRACYELTVLNYDPHPSTSVLNKCWRGPKTPTLTFDPPPPPPPSTVLKKQTQQKAKSLASISRIHL